jgi:hypothetical protein
MLGEPIVKSSQPAWREQTDRQLKPMGASTPSASFNQPDDNTDPDPPPAAPAVPPWLRVFPGL